MYLDFLPSNDQRITILQRLQLRRFITRSMPDSNKHKKRD